MELFIIRVKFAIYYFLHWITVRQVAARLQAKSAIYDCLVLFVIAPLDADRLGTVNNWQLDDSALAFRDRTLRHWGTLWQRTAILRVRHALTSD